MIFGDLRRLSQVFGSVRASSEIFGRFRVVFSSVRAIFGHLRKVSHDLRRSSKYIGWPPAVFVLTLDIFVVICTRVTLFCTVLTKNVLLFSQSELSNFFQMYYLLIEIGLNVFSRPYPGKCSVVIVYIMASIGASEDVMRMVFRQNIT